MKQLLLITSIMILSFVTMYLIPGLPWFTPFFFCLLGGMLTGFLKIRAFPVGFVSVTSLWLIMELFFHFMNGGVVSQRMAALFSENLGLTVSAAILLVVTPILGGLLGGLFAWSGKLFITRSEDSNRARHQRRRRNQSYKIKLN